MIKEILKAETCDVNVEVETWQDAVRYAGRLLYEAGAVEESYIDGMIDIVNEMGPYIVLVKGIALAHARPEAGAKKIGLSLITLRNPVCFGHPDNDPVRMVFALSALDSTSHMELISEMGRLFYDEEGLYGLLNCKGKDELVSEVYRIISQASDVWN